MYIYIRIQSQIDYMILESEISLVMFDSIANGNKCSIAQDYVMLKKFCIVKEMIAKSKRHSIKRKTKNSLPRHNRNWKYLTTNNPIKNGKWEEDWLDTSSKKTYIWYMYIYEIYEANIWRNIWRKTHHYHVLSEKCK